MKKVITYGTYDLFHQGHYNILKRAKELGDYLIVGVTTDNFDLERGKLNVCNNVMERIESVRATGLADQIVIEEYVGQKIDDIKRFGVDIFAIGSDWEGKFDYLKEFCQVVYLPRTEGISSTQLREKREQVRIGIIGTGSIANRFAYEAKFVSSNCISAVYNPDFIQAAEFAANHHIPVNAKGFQQFLDNIDAAYIASPHLTHPDYTFKLLENNKHVICETPFAFDETTCRNLFDLAEKRNLVLMSALKTAFCPAFGHLISMLKSGRIGEIVDVSNNVTSILPEHSDRVRRETGGGSINENSCFCLLPIFKLFGTNFKDITFYSKFKNDSDIYTKAQITFPNGVATFGAGIGVKSEGNLIVAGTKGYAYVPAPWWKTDYFELRFEDQNQNRKFFYPYEGDGLRYEIKEFVSSIINHTNPYTKLSIEETIKMAEVIHLFENYRTNVLRN